jgi:uncharacterized protein YkwD
MSPTLLLCALASAALLASLPGSVTTSPAAPAAPGPGGRGSASDPEVRELARLVNQHRRRVGCPPLEWHPTLARVARRHSADMARRGFFGHVSPDGDDPFDRLEDAGVDYAVAAENVAAGHRDARALLAAWLRSRGHRANIERCACTHHGIGRVENRWTHVLVRFRGSPR